MLDVRCSTFILYVFDVHVIVSPGKKQHSTHNELPERAILDLSAISHELLQLSPLLHDSHIGLGTRFGRFVEFVFGFFDQFNSVNRTGGDT